MGRAGQERHSWRPSRGLDVLSPAAKRSIFHSDPEAAGADERPGRRRVEGESTLPAIEALPTLASFVDVEGQS